MCNDNFLPQIVFANFSNTLRSFIDYLTKYNPELKEFTITTNGGNEIYEISEDLKDDEDELQRNENNANKLLFDWFGTLQGEVIINVNILDYELV